MVKFFSENPYQYFTYEGLGIPYDGSMDIKAYKAGIQFRAGEYETADPKVIEGLRSYIARFMGAEGGFPVWEEEQHTVLEEATPEETNHSAISEQLLKYV